MPLGPAFTFGIFFEHYVNSPLDLSRPRCHPCRLVAASLQHLEPVADVDGILTRPATPKDFFLLLAED